MLVGEAFPSAPVWTASDVLRRWLADPVGTAADHLRLKLTIVPDEFMLEGGYLGGRVA
jgi:hypothetical protein